MANRPASPLPYPSSDTPILDFHRSSALGAWSADLTVKAANGVYVVIETVSRMDGQFELPPGVVLESEEGVAAFMALVDGQVRAAAHRHGVAPSALIDDLLRRLNELANLPHYELVRCRSVDGGASEVGWLRDGVLQTLDLQPTTGIPETDRSRLELADDIWDGLSVCLVGPDPLDREA